MAHQVVFPISVICLFSVCTMSVNIFNVLALFMYSYLVVKVLFHDDDHVVFIA